MDYKLQDVDQPNLYREMFPYSEFPKMEFETESVPLDIPDKVWITDTTFRDGQQARPPYSPEQVLRIFDFLHEIDGGTDLIRQCEFFLYSDRDRKAVELCQERGYEFPEITGWIRAVAADFQICHADGPQGNRHSDQCQRLPYFPETQKDPCTGHAVLSGHRQRRRWITASCRGAILKTLPAPITTDFILPFAAELLKLSQQYNVPVKMRLCDTLGFALPYPNATLPRSRCPS